MNQDIDSHFQLLLDSLKNFIRSETVVGKPIIVGETTVIPVFRVSLGLGAGAGSEQREGSSRHTSQAGSGAGATIVPYGVISITNGETTVLPLARNSFEGITQLLPDLMQQIKVKGNPGSENEPK